MLSVTLSLDGSSVFFMAPKSTVSEQQVSDAIVAYLKKANRPFSEVQSNIKDYTKAIVTKLLTSLQEEGVIYGKLYNKTWIYLTKQDELPTLSPDELQQFDTKIESMKESNSECKQAIKRIEAGIVTYQSQMTDDQLEQAIKEYTQQNSDRQTRLSGLQSGALQMTEKDKKKINANYDSSRKIWLKRKRMIWDTYSENIPSNLKEHMEELGIETDEMVGADASLMVL